MANDVADYTSSVVIQSGTVTISGTSNVSIVGTPTVSISGTPNVNIANTPAVTISSGSVTIANASIGVINAAGTKITSSRPPLDLSAFGIGASLTTTVNIALPADIQALFIQLLNPLANYAHIKVAMHGGGGLVLYVPLELYSFAQFVYVIPIPPRAYDTTPTEGSTIDVTLTTTAAGGASLLLVALFEPNPLWLELFPQPQLAPNQSPLNVVLTTQATLTAKWLILPVTNIEISLFELITTFILTSGAINGSYIAGHGTTLPVASPTAGVLFVSGNTGAFAYPYHGANLPRGDGVWLWNETTVNLTSSHLINYSLS